MNFLGVAYRRQGRLVAAYRSFSAAVRLDPANESAQGNLWRTLLPKRLRGIAVLVALYGGVFGFFGLLFALAAPFVYPRHGPWWGHVVALSEAGVATGIWLLLRWRWSRLDPVLRGVLSRRVGGHFVLPRLRRHRPRARMGG
jgi:hypothetical protein